LRAISESVFGCATPGATFTPAIAPASGALDWIRLRMYAPTERPLGLDERNATAGPTSDHSEAGNPAATSSRDGW
jgi:hypothetical protein